MNRLGVVEATMERHSNDRTHQHVVDLQTARELFFSAAVVASLVVTAVSLAQ